MMVATKTLTALVFSGIILASFSSNFANAQSGIASHYGYTGNKTASGERANPGGMTAAHRSLPFGTKVKVTNKRNGRSVVVTITDRGPFIRGRVIDLTTAGASAIGMGYGLAPVSLDRL